MSTPVRRRLRRAALIASATALTAAALTVTVVGRAGADGDPASDELIAQNVFFPYSSPVPGAEQRRLDREVSAAHRAGIDLKVALIARRSDLGSVTALFGAPQGYARFLDTEISLERKIPLLVVMRDGFGTEGLSRMVQRAVFGTRPPSAGTGAALTTAAIAAVARIDTARGVAHLAGASGGSPFPTHTIILFGLVVAALLVGCLLAVARILFPPSV